MSVRDRLRVRAHLAGWQAVRRLPEPAARALFAAGADLAVRRGVAGAPRLRANLARVVAATPSLAGTDLDALTRAGMRSYARYWQESFRLPSISRSRLVTQMRVIGEDCIRAAGDAGRGVILALPHMGNWDLAGAWLCARGIPFTTVVERLEPAALFDRFVAFRERLGMEVLPLTGGPPPFEALAARLREGRVVCLLADRDLTGSGRAVRFFGARAAMPAGPALLALRTGAVLLPVSLWFDDPAPWNGRVHEPVPHPERGRLGEQVDAMTQALADVFAQAVAAHPQDWHMVQRVWLDERAPAGKPAGAG